MKLISCETEQKLRGGYYTPIDLAFFLTRWVLGIHPERILEPACGDGIFVDALIQLPADRLQVIHACEINLTEASQTRLRAQRLPESTRVEIHSADFLGWALCRHAEKMRFDAVLGNPPFIRYQYLDGWMQDRSEQIFAQFGLKFTRHTNAWVPFVIAALGLLRPGGRLAMVVPAELLHVLHAQSLRRFLLEQCSRILIIDPESLWFDGTLQGTVLLLAEKRLQAGPSLAELSILSIKDRHDLAQDPSLLWQRAEFFPGSEVNDKWMLGLLRHSERSLFDGLRVHSRVRRFAQVASVDVGIVTGANHFFLVPDAVVHTHQLQRWAHPMYGRSGHVRGVIYDVRSLQENRRLGLPANFLWFGATAWQQLPAPARHYIRNGEAQGLHQRYKCRIRSPWYNVPSVYATPIGMLKRAHHFPRLVLNRAKAFTTDTAYRIQPRRTSALRLVYAFVNSLTALSAELEGRHYGGGVLELVPSEIERMLIPLIERPPVGALRVLDDLMRTSLAPESVLAAQDERVLGPVGLSRREMIRLRDAWHRLSTRRQRASE